MKSKTSRLHLIAALALLSVCHFTTCPADLHAAEAPEFTGPGIVWNEENASAVRHDGDPVLAMNVGGDESITLLDVEFQPGVADPEGGLSVTSGGTKCRVQSNAPDGGIAPSFSIDPGYSNNPDYARLFNSGMSTETSGGEIRLLLSGLQPGTTYILHTFHFQPNAKPAARNMKLVVPASPPSSSPAFTYHNPESNTATNAVRMETRWTASSPDMEIILRAAEGFNRAVLNAIALHAVNE